MKVRSHVVTLAALTFVATESPSFAYDLVSFWESRNAAVTDTFYTTYVNDHNLAISADGHVEHGVAAWIPCAVDTLLGPNGENPYRPAYPAANSDNPLSGANTHGYSNQYMNFTCAQPSGAAPLYRLYHGAPATDHLYTTSSSEVTSLESNGYSFDRVEGYVFNTQVANSVPLYRLSLGAGIPNHDVEHRYTISASAMQSLLNAGWTSEGVTGYVFASYINPTVNATGFIGTYNGYTISQTTNTSVPIQNVVPTTATLTFGGQTTGTPSYQYGVFASNTTIRPAGSVRQYVSFNFYSGDLFSGSSGLNHIPIYLHYASAATSNQLSALPPYDGIALVIGYGGTNSCGYTHAAGGQLYVELGNARAPYTPPGSSSLLCDPTLLTPMQDNTWYTIAFTLDDSANVSASVSNIGTGQNLVFANGGIAFSKSYAGAAYYKCPFSPAYGSLSPDQTYCANPFSSDGFPTNDTGYMIFPYFTGTTNDTTAQISDTQVSWLNY